MTAHLLRFRHDGMIRLQSAIMFSVLVHALILTILFFSPAFPSRTLTFGPAYSVDLVSAPGTTGQSATAALSKEVMKESLKESARDNSITLKKSIVTKSTPLLKQDEPSRTQDADRLNKAIEDLKRKTAAADGGGSVASGQGTASLMNRYYALIWSRVRQNWALPSSLVSDKNLEAVIDVTVLRDGTVTGIRFEKRSGNSYFDSSAERAIQKSDPFPALPTWIQDSSVELGIRFRSADYKR